MKIYTKRGDTGETDLFGGERVKKNNTRVKAYGDIDCANTALGLAYSTPGAHETCREKLSSLMKLLFVAGAEVSTSSKESAHTLLEKHLPDRINESHIKSLEDGIDEMEAAMEPLKNFILPCGTDLSARLHFARNMARIAEISLIDLAEEGDTVRLDIIKFFNRLSDYLFVMARFANHEAQVPDITWSGKLA